ncbi:DNA polymerase III subunit epsilon [Sphingobacterium psychroaquaticum]|uniref:exonuclease domain-containing protein n=1 Tax=Sphingobacterium psychroaquaticum TaxID=561061 RepID=UPI00106DC1A9|nr:exonuclease domain-containing protein [Sphingobacterium psychroaquaticum]QBQ41467.1 DNA polymerase III subunit epsilon [Sphingobacterium psychroaquaticum]
MNKQKHFALVDIETTGSHAGGAKITEVAILIHNGKKVIERYHTLINPDVHIPYAIQTLTGISNEMVEDAPRFEEIAEDIFHLLQGKVFVAHNVNFDYSFLNKELKQSGYDWQAQKLCTVRLSRKILPGHRSYSLGNLCRALDIEITDRHRAMGDVEATVKLFDLLLAQDDEGHIQKSLQVNTAHRLPTHIPKEQFDKLPETTGVYILRNQKGKIVYVGKALNIKKRVFSHFSGNNSSLRRQQFINEVCHIDFEESGTELMALLMECQLIKKHWPIYNNALKKYEPKFVLFNYQDICGFEHLAITKSTAGVQGLQYFETAGEANIFLAKLMQEHQLSPSLCNFYSPGGKDKVLVTNKDEVEMPNLEDHNQTIYTLLEHLRLQQRSFILTDAGRHDEEQSYIYFKEEKLFAFGFIDDLNDWTEVEDIVSYKDKCISNHYMQTLVLRYAETNPEKVRMLQK